jgi:hypothetical protein
VPTKRAPDAGDSAAISGSFPRLIIFLAGRLRRPRPSAGNANRWARSNKLKIMNSMDDKMFSNHQKSRSSFWKDLSFWKDVGLNSIIGIALVSLGCFIIFAIAFWNTTKPPKYLEIDASEVPIYTNAQNISQEGPITEDATDVYLWSFSSKDAPDVVWQFYVDEMSQRWGFYDVSSPQSLQRSLIVNTCPLYYLEMTSTLIDSTTYNYVIQFTKELCR